LSFDKFIKAQEQLAILLHEVDKTLANKNRPLINWRISQVHSGSIHLTLEGMPQDQITPSQISEVIKTVERGIVTILEHPIRPKYFSDRALESARSLAILKKRDEFMVQLGFDSRCIDLNQALIANVDEIIGGKYQSFGTVEGVLKAIDVSRQPIFRVYNLLTNKSVKCYFKTNLLDNIKEYLEKRVSVSGIVTSREDGEKIGIKVESIDIFPEEKDLPSIEEMIGILGGSN
jgi:hypothetical protein